MLYLVFRIGADRYAIPAVQVVELLPLVELKSLLGPPRGVAGLFDYHGTPVPAVDLTLLALGRPSAPSLTTRLAVVSYSGTTGGAHLLGVIAEHLTETLQAEEESFQSSGVASAKVPYLGPVRSDPAGIIQRVRVEELLPLDLREALFRDCVPEPAHGQPGD